MWHHSSPHARNNNPFGGAAPAPAPLPRRQSSFAQPAPPQAFFGTPTSQYQQHQDAIFQPATAATENRRNDGGRSTAAEAAATHGENLPPFMEDVKIRLTRLKDTLLSFSLCRHLIAVARRPYDGSVLVRGVFLTAALLWWMVVVVHYYNTAAPAVVCMCGSSSTTPETEAALRPLSTHRQLFRTAIATSRAIAASPDTDGTAAVATSWTSSSHDHHHISRHVRLLIDIMMDHQRQHPHEASNTADPDPVCTALATQRVRPLLSLSQQHTSVLVTTLIDHDMEQLTHLLHQCGYTYYRSHTYGEGTADVLAVTESLCTDLRQSFHFLLTHQCDGWTMGGRNRVRVPS